MELNVKPYNNHQLLLLPPSISEFLPEDHLAHLIDEIVEHLDLSCLYKKISPVGNPPYHPKLMVKILFYGYATQRFSSFKIEEALNTDVAFIFLIVMQKPDFRTISDFRKNNWKELKEIFAQIVQICRDLGMIKLEHISLDGKTIKANASASKTRTYESLLKEQKEIEEKIEECLKEAEKIDEEEDKKYGEKRGYSELPDEIKSKAERIKKLKKSLERIKEAKKRLEEDKKDKINLTDNDAEFQKDKGKRKIPGYRGEIIVDKEEKVIIGCDVTNEQADTHQLIPMINQVKENLEIEKLEPYDNDKTDETKLSADSAFSSGPNLIELEKENLDGYIPDRNFQAKENGKETKEDDQFHKNKFKYYKEGDYFECPAGKILKFIYRKKGDNGEEILIYQCCECVNCEYFGKCTTNKDGRTVQVSEYEELYREMRNKLSTEEGREIYRQRKAIVEAVFGNLSWNLNFREFLLRGLNKVRGEFALLCSVHNILKILKFLKNLGRRFGEVFLNSGKYNKILVENTQGG